MSPVEKFLELTAQDKLLAVRIFFLLGWAKVQLSRKSLKEIFRDLEPSHSSVQSHAPAKAMGKLVEQVAGYTPWESNCLVRALCCGFQLNALAIPFKIHIGTQLVDDVLEAHAWVRVDGETICGDAEADLYQEITQFGPDSLNFDHASRMAE